MAEPVRADVAIVGARCAGSAAAIAFARAGRRVVALDRARFPADTLSTHLLWAGGVAELKRLGALARVESTGAPRLPAALAGWDELEIHGTYTPVDGIDYGLCVRRTGMDAALVDAARAAGAEVREGHAATSLVMESGRPIGVRYRRRDGGQGEVRAALVVGADGRSSLVARELGVSAPGLANRNGRGCYYAYWSDPDPARRSVAAQWRHGAELATAFPCDGGLVLVLLMPPVERAADFAGRLAEEYDRTAASIPGLSRRLAGGSRESKVRHIPSTTSYFRRSSGPGWALPGDAGHFKDPVTAQGIRDGLRFGRLLGEMCAPHLEDAAALDEALAAWERRRDSECLETYQWTNSVGRAEPMNPIEAELYRQGARDPELGRLFMDVFSRVRRPAELVTPRRSLGLLGRALMRPGADRRWALRVARRELRAMGADSLERARVRRRGFVVPR